MAVDTLADSTSNGNNATNNGATSTTGQINSKKCVNNGKRVSEP